MSQLRLIPIACATVALLVLSSCNKQTLDDMKTEAQKTVELDSDLRYDQDDFSRGMMPRSMSGQASAQDAGSSVPDLAPVLAQDKKNILPQPLVSITVNQDVSLRDLFYELAKQAEVDLELDPTITGSIIFTAYNRPFDQVVERIADMAGLRYHFKNNVLRVERDTPYLKTYSLDYLSMTRKFTSSISSNTSAATSGSGGGSGGTNGSNSTIASESNSDFWKELETNITQIIGTTGQQVNLTDQSAPITTPTAIPAVTANQLATIDANGNAVAPVPTPAATPTQSAPPVAGLANPTGTQTAATTATGGSTSAAPANPYFSLNKQAGLLNIFATEKQHHKVAEYLERLRRTTSTQVLVEAKVFEVELNDEHAAGVDWTAIYGNTQVGSVFGRPDFIKNPVPDVFSTGGKGGAIVYSGPHVNAVIQAISRYGTVRTLSSPRLTVMNNQTAVLNVSESRVFFDLKIDKTDASSNGPATTDVTSTVKSVPEGVIIAVHPSVDMNTNEILMNLRPSITRVVDTVNDPAVAYLNISGIENLVPELSVRELDSVVRMHSGETVVMGGLMQDRASGEQSAIPVLGKAPIIGPLFRNNLSGIKKTEMVIFLRAKVVETARPEETDKRLYNEFGANDRRRFDM